MTRLDLRLRRIPDWAQFCLAMAAVAGLAAASATDDGREAHVADFFLLPVGAVAWLAHRRFWTYLTASVTVAVTIALSLAASAHVGATLALGAARLAMYVIVIAVLTALRNERATILRAASVDHQTGVANHRAFEARAQRELERSRRYGHAISLLFLDIDDFKQVNDRFGHAAGDRALEAVAKALCTCVRRNDIVGRLGGDEFAVLMPEADAEAASALARRMQEVVHLVETPDGCSVCFSVGVATFSAPPDSVDELLRAADHLMYRAKREGKDRIARSE